MGSRDRHHHRAGNGADTCLLTDSDNRTPLTHTQITLAGSLRMLSGERRDWLGAYPQAVPARPKASRNSLAQTRACSQLLTIARPSLTPRSRGQAPSGCCQVKDGIGLAPNLFSYRNPKKTRIVYVALFAEWASSTRRMFESVSSNAASMSRAISVRAPSAFCDASFSNTRA